MRNSLAGLAMSGLAALAPGARAMAAEPYTVLHSFAGPDGQYPVGGVTVAPDGTIYGTTNEGGQYKYFGTVFKSDPSGHVVIVHSFDLTDGEAPSQSSPTLLGDTLYGTTVAGGNASDLGGVIYSVKTDGTGYTVLHNFNGYQGYYPVGVLQHVPGRGFVGVTFYGGQQYTPSPSNLQGHGVLFALTRSGRYRILHKFSGSPDGVHPNFLLTDAAGDVFGSAQGGGICAPNKHGCGLIFKYDLATEQYSILYTFTGGQDSAYPILGSMGADGTLYGATIGDSGPTRYGTLFALKPGAAGYTLETLTGSAHNLFQPQSGPTLTARGLLIGTTQDGLYAYNLNTRKRTLLQSLTTLATGTDSYAQPAVAGDGSILGTTAYGGLPTCAANEQEGCGTLFRYTYTQDAPATPGTK